MKFVRTHPQYYRKRLLRNPSGESCVRDGFLPETEPGLPPFRTIFRSRATILKEYAMPLMTERLRRQAANPRSHWKHGGILQRSLIVIKGITGVGSSNPRDNCSKSCG